MNKSVSTIRSIWAAGLLFVAMLAIGGGLQYWNGTLNWGGYLAISFFYAITFYLGLAVARKETEHADQLQEMMLAGRTMPLWIALLTMTATWVGGGFTNGTAESVAGKGLAWAQAPWGYSLSLFVGGLVFARPMRRRNYTTMLDPLEDRFGAGMAGILYVPALLGEVFWTAAILTALGTTFGLILEIEFNASIIISALVAIVYTSFGGLRSVAITDVFQLAILMIGLTIALVFVMPEGGIYNLYSAYQSKMGENAVPWPSWSWGDSWYRWWDEALLLIFGGIPWHVYFQRVLAAKSESSAQWLSIGAGLLCFVAAIPSVIIGMICVTTDWSALGLTGPEDAAVALPYVLKHLAPPIIAMIGLGALAAAVMASVDSSILSASSMGAWNVYRPLFRRSDDSAELYTVVRRLIWIIGISAMLLALQIQSVYALWFLCSDFVYCILFSQLITALFDPRANPVGSIAGFLVATVLRLGGGEPMLGLPQWIPYPLVDAAGTVNFPYRTFSMIMGLLTIVLVSRLTQKISPPRPLISRVV